MHTGGGHPLKSGRPLVRLVALTVATVLAAGGWLATCWLARIDQLPGVIIVAAHTSLWWAVWCLLLTSAVSLVAAGLLISVAMTPIRKPLLRAAVGVIGSLAWAVGAFALLVICWFSLFCLGLEGSQTFVTADDGTAVMITQDGFDGDMVDFYDPGPGRWWIRRDDTARIDPRDGHCTLTTTSATLTVTCGHRRQTIPRN